jgi:hypothetical protein
VGVDFYTTPPRSELGALLLRRLLALIKQFYASDLLLILEDFRGSYFIFI